MTLRAAVVRVLKHADIRACPHVIMVPEHYRKDGTCQCNNPKHLVMKQWGYEWNADKHQWTAPKGDE